MVLTADKLPEVEIVGEAELTTIFPLVDAFTIGAAAVALIVYVSAEEN